MTALATSRPHLIDRLAKPRGRLVADAPLGPQTWFGTGGPAEVLFRPADTDERCHRRCREHIGDEMRSDQTDRRHRNDRFTPAPGTPHDRVPVHDDAVGNLPLQREQQPPRYTRFSHGQRDRIVGKAPRLIKPAAGETYHAIESPKGELGYFIVSDGKSTNPYRFRVRPPSFCNLQGLRRLVRGHLVADVVALIGSIDIVLGEVDR